LVVGGGGIAQEIVRLTKSFSAHVSVVRRSQKAVNTADLTIGAAGLHTALRTADVVIIAAALTQETKGMIGKQELALLGPNTILVNVSRGELLDTDALVSALKAGTILGAGLDVTDPEPLPDGHPLWDEPRALITPHTADTMEMRVPHYAERVSENVRRFVLGRPLNGRVDPDAGY
jgi:phosphoglycerate dehydrogenase-like enzyme